MKHLLFVFITLAMLSFTAIQQFGNEGFAQVQQIDGFDIYMYSEPVAEYEEVFNVSGFWNWSEVLEERATLDNIVNTMARNARKKNRKAHKFGEPKADAIIIYDNDNAIGIRYAE